MPQATCKSVALIVLLLVVAGCGEKTATQNGGDPELAQGTSPEPTLREKLKLKPDEGRFETDSRGRITVVELDRTPVTDLSPLSGLPLEQLYLRHTNVRDLTPLKGMPLKFLNVMGTRVTDITVVKTLDLHTLWLNDTRVKDLSPLKGKSLVSLDLTGTPVTDLSPIAGMKSLRRLNLERCAVKDLAPLEGLTLQRIVFHPSSITNGLDAVRGMESLELMHSQFQIEQKDWLSPEEFWKRAKAWTLPKK